MLTHKHTHFRNLLTSGWRLHPPQADPVSLTEPLDGTRTRGWVSVGSAASSCWCYKSKCNNAILLSAWETSSTPKNTRLSLSNALGRGHVWTAELSDCKLEESQRTSLPVMLWFAACCTLRGETSLADSWGFKHTKAHTHTHGCPMKIE